MKKLLTMMVAAFFGCPLFATTWYVNGTSGSDSYSGKSSAAAKKTIQAAIDASSAGDTVLVAPGRYAPISTNSKSIEIRSTDGAAQTIIDGNGTSVCANLGSSRDEGKSTTLVGFSLERGYRNECGAAIQWGIVKNCIIRNCTGWAIVQASSVINCLAYGNKVTSYGVFMHGDAYNCTIIAQSGDRAAWDNGFYNCILVGGIYKSSGQPESCHNCRTDNYRSADPGNITGEPAFVDADNGDYRLAQDSPCIDVGNNSYVTGETDLDGNVRIANGKVDIGCYEYGASDALTAGLVAWYKFDSNANDSSSNGNSGVVHGATPTADRFGNANSAYSFDGNDWIEVANSISLQSVGTAYTIAVWVNPKEWYSQGSSGYIPIVCKGYQFGLEADFANYENISLGTWQQITVVQSNGVRDVYLNGSFVRCLDNRVDGVNSLELEIGRDSPGLVEYLNGSLDDLRIYNRVLSAAEVKALYEGGGLPVVTKCAVTFDAAGGVAEWAQGEVAKGAAVGALPTATRAGYEFLGWYTAASGGTKVSAETVVTADVTLYAHWVSSPSSSGDVSVVAVTAQQRYPWNGLVDITVTIQGAAEGVAATVCAFVATNGATKVAIPVEHITRNGDDSGSGNIWTRKFIWDAKTDVGAMKIDDVALTVDMKLLSGVQLWENGPCWAECNVGATKPEECGYYFWWGDTVGCKRDDDDSRWISVKDSTAFGFGRESCPTHGKDNSQLQLAGYIDETGNLVVAHDTATAHLGAPWRMPTYAEFAALIDNCNTEWTTRNGVTGRLVTGKGMYSTKSIFFPAAGDGYASGLRSRGSSGYYWSSASHSDGSGAWNLSFDSRDFGGYYIGRYYGKSVRPVRGFVDVNVAIGGVTIHMPLDCQAFYRTVTFEPNGGNCSTVSKSYGIGDSIGALPEATRSGYTFDGWYTEAGGGAKVAAETVVKADMTLYAHWTMLTAAVFVSNVEVGQRYPWNGLVDVVVTLQGAAEDVSLANCQFVATNSATKVALPVAHITQSGIDTGSDMTWTRKYIWDATADVGEVKIDDVALTVEIELPYVQLWNGGPYWAKCNVGATRPEEYGYYFWWGDTVGYKRNANDDGWISVKNSRSFSFSDCPTYDKNNSQLQAEGYINARQILVAAHDAATAHLGTLWRMPTNVELVSLIDNCDEEWTTRNGVYGRLVKGRGAYSAKSIFLPAAGYGSGSDLNGPGSRGHYWTSASKSGYSVFAWYLGFSSSDFSRDFTARTSGMTVRPLRGAAGTTWATFTGSALTMHLSLDCRKGARMAFADGEELNYDASWYANGSQVLITDNGEIIEIGSAGTKRWTAADSACHHLQMVVVDVGGLPVGSEDSYFVPAVSDGAVAIPDTWAEIPDGLFKDCDWLKSVTIPSSVKKVAANAFAGCDGVTNVVLHGGTSVSRTEPLAGTAWIKESETLNGDKVYKSNTIGHNQSTVIEFEIPEGMERLIFSWKVGSEQGYDWLTWYLDDVQKDRISGSSGWTTLTNELDGVKHRLKFVYSKDDWTSTSPDCGWVSVHASREGVPTLADLFPDSPITVVTIGDGIGELPDGFAADYATLESVSFPRTIASIGADAFVGCENLKRVNVEALEDWLKIDFANESANPLSVGADLYVCGERLAYRVEFDMNCELSAPPAIECKPGLSCGELPTVARNRYALEGWYTAAVGGTNVSAETIVTEDVTLYAHWSSVIAFDANGGMRTPDAITRKDGELYGELPTVVRSGYVFDGWYTAADGGTKIEAATVVTGPVTLYAHWTVSTDEFFVSNIEVHQRNPWNGLVDVVVTIQGTAEDVASADCLFAAKNGATQAEIPVKHVTRNGEDTGSGGIWTRKFIWDAKADVGAAKIDDVALIVGVEIPPLGCVRLWENGPCWAECNVGATKPEECGYYFWWGDTVGYKRNANNDGWISVLDSTSYSFSKGVCPTYGKENSQLQLVGYVDATGTLVAAHDAATAHLGVPWRMPTDAEFAALADNCTTAWTTRNGVSGQLVMGKGAYSSRSIFLPAVGLSAGFGLLSFGSRGYYWSSTPDSGYSSNGAVGIEFLSNYFGRSFYYRSYGQSVRPLREFVSSSASIGGVTTHLTLDCQVFYRTVTFDTNGGECSMVSKSYGIGASIGELPEATRNGYTFEGWYTAAVGGMKVDGSMIVTEDVTYFAHWNQNGEPPTPPEETQFQVLRLIPMTGEGGRVAIGDGNNDYQDVPVVGEFEVETDVQIKAMPKPGYSFGGWYTDEGCTQRLRSTTDEDLDRHVHINESLPDTLWAKFVLNSGAPVIVPSDTWYAGNWTGHFDFRRDGGQTISDTATYDMNLPANGSWTATCRWTGMGTMDVEAVATRIEVVSSEEVVITGYYYYPNRFEWTLDLKRTGASYCKSVMVGDGGTDWMDGEVTKNSAIPPAVTPSVEGDEEATVTGDAETGFVVRPSEGKTAVEVTIPQGVDAAKVTIEVSPKVASVKPNGAKVKIVSGGSDVTEFLNVPAVDGNGVIDLTKATVKEEIVKETLNPEKGAVIELNAANPSLTTSNTRIGLLYTFSEGRTLSGMDKSDSKTGDGQPWSPEIKVKGGNSAFYTIGVGKGE